MMIRPIPVPRKHPTKLKLDVAPGQAEVYVHQTAWPRQKQNPNWRIEVRGIDARHSVENIARIEHACRETARIYLRRWLKQMAPLLTLETVSWPELMAFATCKKRLALSRLQLRHQTKRGTWRHPAWSWGDDD